MELTEEFIQQMLDAVTPVVAAEEPVYAGFRATQIHYVISPEFTVVEVIEYYEPPTSEGWSNIKTKKYYVL